MSYNKYNKEIILCINCKGEGVLYHHEITDYHRNEYDVIKTECDGRGPPAMADNDSEAHVI